MYRYRYEYSDTYQYRYQLEPSAMYHMNLQSVFLLTFVEGPVLWVGLQNIFSLNPTTHRFEKCCIMYGLGWGSTISFSQQNLNYLKPLALIV